MALFDWMPYKTFVINIRVLIISSIEIYESLLSLNKIFIFHLDFPTPAPLLRQQFSGSEFFTFILFLSHRVAWGNLFSIWAIFLSFHFISTCSYLWILLSFKALLFDLLIICKGLFVILFFLSIFILAFLTMKAAIQDARFAAIFPQVPSQVSSPDLLVFIFIFCAFKIFVRSRVLMMIQRHPSLAIISSTKFLFLTLGPKYSNSRFSQLIF